MSDPAREELAELTRLLVTHTAWLRELGGSELPLRGELPGYGAAEVPASPVARASEPAPAPVVEARPQPATPVTPAAPVAPPAPVQTPAWNELNAPASKPVVVEPPKRVVAPAVRALFAEFEPPASPAAGSPRGQALVVREKSPPLEGPARIRALEVIQEEVRGCTKCGLAAKRHNTVFSRGNPMARLAFVGEGPGEQEDLQGLPFVGRAGQLLDRIVTGMGLTQDDIYIANVVKCLRYTTLVQLENGSWERVGRLVRQRYAGRVMSMLPDGRLEPRRVIGWHVSPLGERKVYKLSYASAASRGGKNRTTWLTEDHEVLTERGWVAARDLQPDDRIATGQGLSRVAHEVVVGTLLGDSSISPGRAHLEMVHSRDQKAYVHLKARALAELGPIVDDSTTTAAGREYLTTRCRTRAFRAGRILRQRFYPDGRKRIPDDLVLTPRVVAVWFMDDGYTRVRTDHNALAEIAAHSFTAGEIARLIDLLRRDVGLEAYTRESSPGRILFGAESTRRLSELIAPFCPPSMRYKLPPAVAARVAFDARLYEPEAPETFYDRVVVEPVEYNGTDRTFFCLDVEETHNFVTSGGVVHNCRPPGNRVPEPDEMSTCGPYLSAQLDLVRPEVIVVLGLTAARYLLKTKSPMSKLRGQWQKYEDIAVMPTWHPAYVLRDMDRPNSTARREVWEDMKLVLAKLGLAVPQK